MAQLYPVAALACVGNKSNTIGAEYRYIVREGRLSGPFPSARCPVYCFREGPFAALARMLPLVEHEWIGKRKKTEEKKKKNERFNKLFSGRTGLRCSYTRSLLRLIPASSKSRMNIFETFISFIIKRINETLLKDNMLSNCYD